MSKPRPKKLYAVVKAKRPAMTHLELYGDRDVKIGKDEEMWEVEVRAMKRVRIKAEVPRRRSGHAHRPRGIPKARKNPKGTSPLHNERR